LIDTPPNLRFASASDWIGAAPALVRCGCVAALCAAALLVCAPARAQSGADAEVGEEAAEPARDTARERELDRKVATIEDLMGIYLAVPERRELLEGVVLKEDRAELWVLRPLVKNIEAARCDAYRWLLLGRLERSKGAPAVFKAFPDLSELTLVFYQVATELDHDGRGGYVQHRSAIRHLEITLSRERAQSLDLKALEKLLKGDRARCIEAGQQSVDHHWTIH